MVGRRANHAPRVADVWRLLAEVADPEIPAVSIVDLGIVRDVTIARDGTVTITITPTYAGCPAMRAIERDIGTHVRACGLATPRVAIALAPAWTTDWISESGRAKLLAYGIAPPNASEAAIACPRCAACATERISRFGSTPCKELRRCTACKEPFDHFKCH